jgi:undecaprenyl-diphosphatase
MPIITSLGNARTFYLYLMLLAIASAIYPKGMPPRVVVVFAIAFFTSWPVEAWLKVMFDVPRPPLAIGIDHVRILAHLPKSNSLPSGHALLAFLAAYVLGRGRSLLWKVPLFLFAFLMLYSRVYVGVHYPLDVFAGALIGLFWGYVVWWVADRYEEKRSDKW